MHDERSEAHDVGRSGHSDRGPHPHPDRERFAPDVRQLK